MSAKSGQVLTWHEECLKCSVCLLSVSLDNVVFKEKLFCKSCYIENNLNKCDKCTKVGSVRLQSGNTSVSCSGHHWRGFHLQSKILARHLLRL